MRVLPFALPLLFATSTGALGDSKPAPPPPPERSEVEVDDPKLKTEIEESIRRGVNWLKARQLPDGSWPGLSALATYGGAAGPADPEIYELTALALLALLKCEVPPDDPAIQKGFKYLEGKSPYIIAYGAGTHLMAIEAKYAHKETIASRDGKRRASKPKPIQLKEDDGVVAAKLMNQLIASQSRSLGGWRYANLSDAGNPPDMEGGKPGHSDVSATQYALLGLKSARNMGIPVKVDVFYKAADYLLDQQDKEGPKAERITLRGGSRRPPEMDPSAPEPSAHEGEAAEGYGQDRIRGWPYMRGDAEPWRAQATGGMTCAGIVGMLICRSELIEDKAMKKPEKAKKLALMEQSVWDGLAWLDAHWGMSNTGAPVGNVEQGYYLYALERVGVMADLRFIGPGHDWYLEGARLWTSRMTPDGPDPDKGYWAIGQTIPPAESQDTPYGLLFLRKAAIRIGYEIGGAEP